MTQTELKKSFSVVAFSQSFVVRVPSAEPVMLRARSLLLLRLAAPAAGCGPAARLVPARLFAAAPPPPAATAAAVSAEPFINGSNSSYVEEMYVQWLRDPSSVHAAFLRR
ncbi:2-oxoglutarate dehydrogenase, mitochondrial [Amphibalanus amphitrite]|uniref:2-oxoglutarate dehydrogenase, mitochondrial n=1 Tax=Amphibalanus amphitrite TaxID=1232801 RepID=A0A6A4WVM0_AMPAM|nr:2-oxoglutarate dehydrogenase, mitochondrial [Amphibalanus amphitrite]